MTQTYPLFISCPKGLEYLLSEELQALGLSVSKVTPQGVTAQATLTEIYQICLWSRLANRVQLILFSGSVHNEQTLYNLCHSFHWQTVFSGDKTLAIVFHGTTKQLHNTMFSAQVIKDAIVDHFRKLNGTRPNVDKEHPQVLLHAHLKEEELTVSLDLTGYSLHQRGYRLQGGPAPLKENLAAALLIRAGWPSLLQQGYAFHDPFCGSGTLVIEAAMIAGNVAPGLLRQDQAFIHWRDHHQDLWEKIRLNALQSVRPVHVKLLGSDQSSAAVALAKKNAERAGVQKLVHFRVQDIANCTTAETAEHGLMVCNPPYGERLDDVMSIVPLYQTLGQTLANQFSGWQAAVLTAHPLLAKAIGLRSDKQYAFYNGAIPCQLYRFILNETNKLKQASDANHLAPSAQMFANRLKKNYQHLQKWAHRNQISCYRVYDADLPEYAFAIDIYKKFVILQEYKAPATIPAHKIEQRSLEVIQTVPMILDIPPENLVIKQRSQQKGRNQYQKLAQQGKYLIVQEGKAQFKVNLYDYLDTGLFLDHRALRSRFAKLAPGTRFLNCYCYTATASVQAALAGAFTTNVDLSNTYLRWAEENFRINHLNVNKHQFIQADCWEWFKRCTDRFQVIFLDPPSFSNSKRMKNTLDIQRDHFALINLAMSLLTQDGELYFSTNLRHFKLSPIVSEKYQVQNITKQTIDEDFKRNTRIHHCFLLKKISRL